MSQRHPLPPSGRRPRAIVLGLLAALSLSWTASAAPSKGQDTDTAVADVSGTTVIGTVGKERITVEQVIAQDQGEFDRLRDENELRTRQLQVREAEAQHTLLQRQTDKLLDRKALELEAQSRGVGVDAIKAEITVPAVTDEETRAYYEFHKSRANGRTFEDLQPEITQYLANQHNSDATRKFYDELRAKHGVTSLLPPYRVAVAANGPVRGRDAAPVTIVEFGDFECPFCRQAEDTVRIILGMHPDNVRLVFRELPLPSLHPNALHAAEAAVCADHQGRFWPMHDALYENQSALAPDDLKSTAKRLGIDMDSFNACLGDPQTLKTIEEDAKAADALNINVTPYFLINGRPLSGSVPIDTFEALVSDELQRAGAKRG
jgi:protein-disulfide isomerase